VFSVPSVPRYYNQNNLSNALFVGQSPAGKKVSTEAKKIHVNRHQATTGEDIAKWEFIVRAVVNCSVYEFAIAL
jgi:hypothetical protein